MSEFTQQEMDAISDMAAAIGAPWNYAANAYRKAKEHYIPPGWTPAKSGYVEQLLAGRKQKKAKVKR